MNLIVITGAPASGKSTVGRAVSEHFGYRFLNNQATVNLASTLYDIGTSRYRKFLKILRNIIAVEIQEHSPAGLVLTICYGGAVSDSFLLPLQQHALTKDGTTLEVPLQADHATLRRRLTQKERAAQGKLTDPYILDQILHHWPLSGIPYLQQVNPVQTDHQDPAQTIAIVLRILEDIL